MIVENPMFKFGVIAATVISFFILGISYLFFEKLITEKEIVITVINKEKFGSEEDKYLIFTPYEVFENSNNFFHRKTDADIIFRKLERGVAYRVRVVGIYLPDFGRLRNITEIIGTEVTNTSK